jgi:hypothetical protein
LPSSSTFSNVLASPLSPQLQSLLLYEVCMFLLLQLTLIIFEGRQKNLRLARCFWNRGCDTPAVQQHHE